MAFPTSRTPNTLTLPCAHVRRAGKNDIMRTWSFVQQKGGSGKSTICTNLAVHAEEKGETVPIVDLDPQSSATLWHAQRGTNKAHGV